METNRQPLSPSKFLSRTWIWTILLSTWALTYIPGLFRPGLLDDADSVHAEASREMLLNHDWVTLYTDGIRYLQKPPLLYWAVTISYKLFGVGEWQTRLPLALSVLGLIWATYIFGRRYFGEEGGFYSALIMATAPGIFIFTRFLISDVLVAMFLTVGLYCFLIAYEQEEPSRWVCWGFALSVALNVLAKGLIGIVFPCLIIPVFLFLTGKLRKIWKLHLLSSTLLFLVVAAPWHILAAIRNPADPSGPQKGFLWSYFVNEHFLRYISKRLPVDYDKVSLGLFWVMLFLWLIPWVVFFVPAFKQVSRRIQAWRQNLDMRTQANLFFALWAGLIMLFFSFSSRQEYYSIPALPALALLTGGWLQREANSNPGSQERRDGRIASTILSVFGTAAFVVTMTVLWQTHPFPPGTDIGDVLVPHPGRYALSLGHLGDLTIESFGLFRAPLWEVGTALLLGTALNWIFRRRGSPRKGNLALAAMMIGVLLCVYQGYVIFSPELSSKNIALKIKQVYKPGDTIVINGSYEWGSDLNFYTGVEVHVLNGRDGDLWFGAFFRDAPPIFDDNASFVRLWNGPGRVFLFTEDFLKDKALQGIDPATVHVFARHGGKVVLTNQPIAGDDSRAAFNFRPAATLGREF